MTLCHYLKVQQKQPVKQRKRTALGYKKGQIQNHVPMRMIALCLNNFKWSYRCIEMYGEKIAKCSLIPEICKHVIGCHLIAL